MEDEMTTHADAPTPIALPPCDDRILWDAWLSLYHFPALAAADDLGLFALLRDEPATAEDLARRLALGPRATEALLGVLAALGLLHQDGGLFALTDVARDFALPDGPFYWGPMLRLMRGVPITADTVRDALRRDKPLVYDGQLPAIWETHELPPAQAQPFTAAMHSLSFPAAVGLARSGAFAGVQRLLDVAGGSGSVSIALARGQPHLRCTVLELPGVCRLADQYSAAYGVGGRVDTLAANMFTDAWPAGHDAVLFSNVFHDWSRAHCAHLARRAFDALPAGGRIYVHEVLLADTKDGPPPAALFSLNMILFAEGKQFTAGELGEVLTEAGFRGITVTLAYGYYSLIRGHKP